MRILLVEDEPKIAAFIKRGLNENADTVDIVYDGEAGYERARAHQFDILILDIMLPKLDGITLCKRLRDEGNETPILMLTAKDMINDRVNGLDAGADDYLVKPFAFRELVARLRAIRRRNTDRRKTTLEVGELKLDLITHRAEREGQSIDLSAKEFALLELLMRHPQQVLTRATIAEHVWDESDPQESNVVDVYISFLRRKIDDPFHARLIQTVHGMGYRLVPGAE